MDSDSDHFESADEDFDYDIKESKDRLKENNKNCDTDMAKSSDVQVNNDKFKTRIKEEGDCKKEKVNENEINLNVDHERNVCKAVDDIVDNIKHVDIASDITINNPETINPVISNKEFCDDESTESTEPSESRMKNEVQRKIKVRTVERPQRTKEKSKLGTKISTDKTQINKMFNEEEKTEILPEPERIPPGITPCWEDEVGWESFGDVAESETKENLYSKKKDVNWEKEEDFEADYMEIAPQKKISVHSVLEKLSDSAKEQSSAWGTWGSWGVSSLLSTATTLTSSVTQGLSTVLESGIGVPDPEELARLHKENEKVCKENLELQPDSKVLSNDKTESPIGFGLGNFVSGVSHITKLVESTGTKVLSGGLDTLEVIGKKTMEVLQEGDPGLKKKRALFKLDHDKPILSHVLREAKEKAEEENIILEQNHFARKAHFETLFDDFHGLVHLEALEMLSKQCDIKLETLIESYSSAALTEIQETMTQIKELCELPEEDEEESYDIDLVREKLDAALADLNVTITYDNLLKRLLDVETWMQNESETNEKLVHQKAIETLAELTAIAVEQFHKTGELLLIKERRSTVDEADSLVQLTTTLISLIGAMSKKFSEKMNAFVDGKQGNVNDLITNIFLEAANSSSYIRGAFQLLIPVLQVGAI